MTCSSFFFFEYFYFYCEIFPFGISLSFFSRFVFLCMFAVLVFFPFIVYFKKYIIVLLACRQVNITGQLINLSMFHWNKNFCLFVQSIFIGFYSGRITCYLFVRGEILKSDSDPLVANRFFFCNFVRMRNWDVLNL